MDSLKWTAWVSMFCGMVCAGCVNLSENVQVAHTTGTNTAQNITQKCDLKPYVCRTIVTMGSKSNQPNGLVRDKTTFDNYWSYLTVDSNQIYTKMEGTDKPQVDWDNQQAFFCQMGVLNNTCSKIVPVKVETDCLSVFITVSKLDYVQNCGSTEVYPIFVYIVPKSDLPFETHWTEDADGDGFSNASEIKIGTDPLDPKSHP